jgi:hypothetical protein
VAEAASSRRQARAGLLTDALRTAPTDALRTV